MDRLAHHLWTAACQNAWANLRLLRACERLSQAEFEAPRVGFFPSIRATLDHVLAVDLYYLDAIERSLAGAAPNPAWPDFFERREPWASAASLHAAQAAADRRLIDACAGLDAAALDRVVIVPRQDGPTREPLGRLLAHLFEHQVHHRGQAHAMLSGTTVAPPQLDEFYCVNDAPLRAAELAALGLSEEALWRCRE